MNMPPQAQQPPQGQPQQQGQPQGDPNAQGGQQNPIIQCIQILGQFIQRLAQRNPAAGKQAAMHLQGLIEAIKGGAGEAKEGNQPPAEEGSEPPKETAQEAKPQGKKKMGAMDMNAKPGAVQVL